MVKSMTGYGVSQQEEADQKLSVEIRALNHRYLDISVKMPKPFFSLEDAIKKVVKNYCNRGRLEIYINMVNESSEKKTIKLDKELLDQYIKELEFAKKEYNLTGSISVDMLTQIEDLFLVEEENSLEEKSEHNLFDHINEAMRQVLSMRTMEGKELENDLYKRLERIKNNIKKLGDCQETVIMEYQERVRKRIDAYIQEPFSAEESRIVQEVAILAEKGDIAEELTRLISHISQFSKSLEMEGSIGRRLDFLVQEMYREINTIGSKSMSSKISTLVVELKSEIEKVKEQVQNIE